jgi:peptidoglycan/xylan/chitin deacetylase (PgdA/CDA1 family)
VLRPVTSGSPLQPNVALTFDDGPDSMQTRNVLAVLAREDAQATFFLNGSSVARHPALAKETVAAGHEVANHGYDHYRMTTVARLSASTNVLRANAIIERTTGMRPRFFRPPHGACDEVVLACADECGLQTVMWSVMADDWHQRATVDSIAANIATATAGSIVLCHDKGPFIAEALRVSIPLLKAKGLSLVTLTSLLRAA